MLCGSSKNKEVENHDRHEDIPLDKVETTSLSSDSNSHTNSETSSLHADTSDILNDENKKDSTTGPLPSEDGSCVSDIGASSPFSNFVSKSSMQKILSLEQTLDADIEVGEDLLLHYLTKNDRKSLKTTLRGGSWTPDHEIRLSLWKQICKHLYNADEQDLYEDYENDLFGQVITSGEIRLPSFVDASKTNSFHLHDDGIIHAKKIISVIEHTKPDITHSPALFSLVCLFLHYMEPSECYNCLYGLLTCKEFGFVHQTKVSMEASKFVMRDLSKKHAKSAYVYLVRNCANIDTVFESWFWWILHDLPFSYLVRVIDCYLLEGIKIFYRVALAILILFVKICGKKSPSKKQEPSANPLITSLRQFCREMPVKIDKLLKTAFSIRGLSRKEIRKLQVKHEMCINSRSHIPDSNGLPMSRSLSGPIVLQSLGSDISCLLTTDMLYSIWTWLPRRFAVCQPELLFTSEEHGHSLITLFQRVENHQPTLIVIKSNQDEIFGAFCSTCWRERKHQHTKNLSYFGTGETFVFTLHPEKRKYDWVGLTDENIPNTANMFQAGDRTVLTIGGGHGEAILLDENLNRCRTETCDTFNNQPLCEHEDFQCKVVEVYGFS